MDGWMDGWMGGWMEGITDRQTIPTSKLYVATLFMLSCISHTLIGNASVVLKYVLKKAILSKQRMH